MTSHQAVNHLVLVTLAGEQLGELTERLKQSGFYFTQVDRGGVLQEIPVSLLIGLDRASLPRLLALVREVCRTRRRFIPAQAEVPWLEGVGMVIEAEVGGATIYALDVERFEQL
ncbi:MAG TPA: cyclic-di-AMP receptor [Anaerolineales bacterium]|nr:cyclic-di-AMP receptor [Anaerolineales bacterium]